MSTIYLGDFDVFSGINHLIFWNKAILSYFEFVLVGTNLRIARFWRILKH